MDVKVPNYPNASEILKKQKMIMERRLDRVAAVYAREFYKSIDVAITKLMYTNIKLVNFNMHKFFDNVERRDHKILGHKIKKVHKKVIAILKEKKIDVLYKALKHTRFNDNEYINFVDQEIVLKI